MASPRADALLCDHSQFLTAAYWLKLDTVALKALTICKGTLPQVHDAAG